MKNKAILFATLAAVCFGLSSCNDEWEDELYTQMVSFKAPNGGNDVYDIHIRYQEDGSGVYQLPVIISGTTDNAADRDIKIGVSPDTVKFLNQEKFPTTRPDLWFKQLPEQYYSFPTTVCHIPAGKNTENFQIDFNLKGLDLSEKWLLPMTVLEDPSYRLNYRKGRCRALLNINLFNDYSGTYSATGMNIYIDGTNTDPAVVDTRVAKVVDANTIFFYAGSVWEEDESRAKYKVNVRFDKGEKNERGAIKGNVTLYAGNPDDPASIESVPENCYYVYEVKPHTTQPYIERRLTTLYLDYYYTDITSDPKAPMRYHVQGTMTMESQYDTRIPDEDQAILW